MHSKKTLPESLRREQRRFQGCQNVINANPFLSEQEYQLYTQGLWSFQRFAFHVFSSPWREEDLWFGSLLARVAPFNVSSRIHVRRDVTSVKTEPSRRGWSVDPEQEHAQVLLMHLQNIWEWEARGEGGTVTVAPVQRPVLPGRVLKFLDCDSRANRPMICDAQLGG